MRPVAPPTCSDFPVSSSMWARSTSTRKDSGSPSSPSMVTSIQPSNAIGSSYWEVWKFFGMSG